MRIPSVSAAVVAFSLLLMTLPFVRSIRVGTLELHRPDRAPPLSGRSLALRDNPVFHRAGLLSSTMGQLPVLATHSERVVDDRRLAAP